MNRFVARLVVALPWLFTISEARADSDRAAAQAVAGNAIPEALSGQSLRPLSLASADFDGDGVPDLAAGFALDDGSGAVVLYHGNVDALYPHSPEARQRRTQGRAVDTPFLSTDRILALAAPPDFLFAGDFDADGAADIAAAAAGGAVIRVFPGDGAGGFLEARAISLSGALTALASGDVGRRDGLPDLVASVVEGGAARALVLQGPEGALRSAGFAAVISAGAGSIEIEGDAIVLLEAAGDQTLRLDHATRAWRLSEVEAADRFAARQLAEGEAATLTMRVGPAAGGRVVLGSDGSLSVSAQAVVSTFVVDSTADTNDVTPGDGACAAAGGECSLRAAIQEANAHAGADAVSFAIPGAGVPQISLLSLPVVTETLTIDGTTQSAGKVMVTGTSNGQVVWLGADNCVLRGIVLNGTGNNGLKIQGNGNVVEGNFFGTTADGTAIQGGMFGPNVYVLSGANNLIGGTTSAARNVIAGGSYGVYLDSGGTTVQGNFIGTDVTGTVDLGSQNQGVRAFTGDGNTIGGALPGAGNVISGNGQAGISLETNDNLVQGNRVGTDVSGTAPIPNDNYGVYSYFSDDNTIGGTALGAGNLISGNGSGGVGLAANTVSNTIVQGNRIGTNADGSAAIPNTGHGIHVVAGVNVQIGGASAGALNLVSGNQSDGIFVTKFATVYPMNMHIQGNFIGTDATGTVSVPNLQNGIEFEYCRDSTVGGTGAGEGNVISGNHDHGVRFDGGDESAHPNQVIGNLIGTNAFGTGPLGNGLAGVYYNLTARGFDAGGSAPGEANVIAYNGGAGIASASGRPVRFRRNVIHSNGGLGVDRGSDGVTPNLPPGTFVYENFPILTDASTSDSGTMVSGTLSSGYALAYTVHVFANPTCDVSGYGEARTYLGSVPVNTIPGVATPFSTTFPIPLPGGSYVTALAVGPDDASNVGAASELCFCRKLAGSAPPGSVPLDVFAIAPARGGNTGDVTAFVAGQGMLPGASVKLERSGQPAVAASDVLVAADGLSLTAVFPLTGRAPGLWDVTVVNPGNASATATSAFTIEAGTQPELWADLLGRKNLEVRGGRETPFFLVYGNRGNVDAPPTELKITLPWQMRVTSVQDANGSPRIVALDDPRTTGRSGRSTIHVYVPKVPATSSTSVEFRVVTISAPPGKLGEVVDIGAWHMSSAGLGSVFTLPVDPAVTLSSSVLVDTPQHFEANVHVSNGAVSGDLHYDVTALDVPYEADLTVVKTITGSNVKYRYQLAIADPPGTTPTAYDVVLEGDASIFAIGRQSLLVAEARRKELQENASVAGLEDAGLLNDQEASFLDAVSEAATNLRIAVGTLAPFGTRPTGIAAPTALTNEQYIAQRRTDAAWQHRLYQDYKSNPQQWNGELGIDALGGAYGELSEEDFIQKVFQATDPTDPRTGTVIQHIHIFSAFDPNEKSGPSGQTDARYVTGLDPMPYEVSFENLESANAAAQEVVVTDVLDASKLDLDSFALGPIAFGSHRVDVPPGATEFTGEVDLRPDIDLIARVSASLDRTAGVATWRFLSLDPATGLPTEDAALGFLPPNVDSPEGQGIVSFTVRAKPGLPSGTVIHNQASIVFDANPAILTADWFNTIDVTAPSSQVAALPASTCSGITVQWSGSDAHSGVARYDVYVSENGGEYSLWQANTAAPSGVFYGTIGSSYAFYSIARDAVGNEEAPGGADATTTIGFPTPLTDVLSPTSGPAGGAPVALTGSGYVAGASVTVGGVPASGVVVSDPTSLTANFPVLPPGALYDVAVQNPGGCASAFEKAWLADFTDVPSSDIFHASVEKIARRGVTVGCGGGLYCLNRAVTRAEMAVFLIKGKYNLSLTPPPATGLLFGDVHVGDFAADWIEQIANEGITVGCGNGNYCPTANITRAEMAVFLLKSKHGPLYAPPPATGTVFGDVGAGDFAAAWIEQIALEGITAGCGNGNFCPGDPVSRGQMAAFLSTTFGF